MEKKFSCGRLAFDKNGKLKPVILANGGGSRDCALTHIDMGFDEIHDKIREIFSLNQTCFHTKLYDFQQQELDTKRYRTFYEYIKQNGLKFRGTLIYICTLAGTAKTTSTKKRTTTMTTSPRDLSQVVKRLPQAEADSTTPPVIIKIRGDSPAHHQLSHNSTLNNHSAHNLRQFLSTSFANYSFNSALDEMINYLRNFTIHEQIFSHLLEYICNIHGFASLTLDPLKQQIGSINEHSKQIYNNALNEIEKRARTVRASMNLNRMKISDFDQNSLIIQAFDQFYRNFNILRDQWNDKMNHNRQSTSFCAPNSSIIPVLSTSLSSTYYSIDPVASTSSCSSSSPHRAYQMSTDQHDKKKLLLFKPVLISLSDLSNVLYNLHYSYFNRLVRKIMNEIVSSRSDLNLLEYQWLERIEGLTRFVEARLVDAMNEEHRRMSTYAINQQLQCSFNRTLHLVRDLFKSFEQYKAQITSNKQAKQTDWLSSQPSSSSSSESKPIINPNQQEIKLDDDQSSEASNSSFGDEVLMEVARGAFEQRSNRRN